MASDDDRADEDTQEGSPEPGPRTADDVIREQQATASEPVAADRPADVGSEPPPAWASHRETPEGTEWQPPSQTEPWQQAPPGQGQQWQQPPSAAQWHQPPAAQHWQQPPAAQQWQQPPAGWTAQQAWGGYDQQPAYGSSVMVIVAGIVLVVIGGLVTIIGLFGVLIGGFVEEAIRQIDDPTIPLEGLGQLITVIFGVLLVVGLLHIISSVGIFLHRSWGRIIGILLAVLGTLMWVLGVAGTMQAAAIADDVGGGLFLPVLLAVAYGYTLFALIAGGHHFRRRWR